MKDTILSEKEALIKGAQVKDERKQNLSSIAAIGFPVFLLILGFVLLFNITRQKNKKEAIRRRIPAYFSLPKLKMSLPATISFTNKSQLPPEAVGVAFLDLIRQGIVSKDKNDIFTLIHQPKTVKKHEQLLIDLLFFIIGKNKTFHFDDLTAYIKDTKNHNKYHTHQMKWKTAILNEQKMEGLYDKIGLLRATLLFFSLVLTPFLFLFPLNELYMWFFFSILLFIITLGFAIFYYPKSWKGLEIQYEWQALKEAFPAIKKEEWDKLTDEAQFIIYIYGLGIKNKEMTKKNKMLIDNLSFPKINFHEPSNANYSFDPVSIYLIGSIASNHFYSANKSVEKTIHSSTSSSSGSTGGGVGGGGGGSGAF
jgi:uncharacterized membrane protein